MILFVYLVLCIWDALANLYDANTTDLRTCKVHYARSGSIYKDFYSLSGSPDHNESLTVDFHFAVMAPSDAHILLAPSETVEKNDPAYEIVIGAGGNTFCDIRRKQKSEVKASVRVKGLLSALDPNFFWLHITKEGTIELGKDGEELPFISWTDPDPLPLNVISFSTWSGIEAKWYFDCERTNQLQEIPKLLTGNEKLRRDFLYHYDPYVRPVEDISTATDILMAMLIRHVDLNEHESTIEVLGVTKMIWRDEKLKWDPEDYDNVETLHIFRREIWRPELILYNGIGDGRDILKDSMMVAHHTGVVQWNPAMYLKAWCDIQELEKWPKDDHQCTLLFGFVRDFESIKLEFTKNESSLVSHESSEWSVFQADVYSDFSVNEMSEPAVFQLVLLLERTSNFYNIIFTAPFLMISITTLLTFWMDPFGQMKISVNCGLLITTTIMILSLALVAPNNSQHAPFLVLLYSFTLFSGLIATLIAAVVVNISRNKQNKPLPHILNNILSFKAVNIGLCLSKFKISDEYGKLETLQPKSQEKIQNMWILFGILIDRISFVIYLSVNVYAMYSLHYHSQ